jgi:hypothetical protein
VVVDATEKGSRSVLANVLDEEMTATWVLVDKVGDIVDKAGDADERSLDCLLAILHETSALR